MRFIVFHDDGPDVLGRRSFTIIRRDPAGPFRSEPHKYDGRPVGYRRGQCFFTQPDRFLDTHVEATEEEANARIAELEERQS